MKLSRSLFLACLLALLVAHSTQAVLVPRQADTPATGGGGTGGTPGSGTGTTPGSGTGTTPGSGTGGIPGSGTGTTPGSGTGGTPGSGTGGTPGSGTGGTPGSGTGGTPGTGTGTTPGTGTGTTPGSGNTGGDDTPTGPGHGNTGGNGDDNNNTPAQPSRPADPEPSSSKSSPSQTPEQSTPSPPEETGTKPPDAGSPSESVNEDGETKTIFTTQTNSPSPTATDSSQNDSSPPSSGGLSTGSIIGLSVAGGVALLGIVGFLVWKFTRKRFSEFDDNEAIKWPELNSHNNQDSHPLPVHTTGRAGFETGSDASLARVETYSNAEHGQDPYAVPPLPHMNPNQPYRDDPTGATGYYDPYRGPVPGTLENGGSAGPEWGVEAIPMTQMSSNGRMSPGPQAAYAGRASPGPSMTFSRASPGPQAAYRMASPAPNQAYMGRTSPAPPMGYGPGYEQYGGPR